MSSKVKIALVAVAFVAIALAISIYEMKMETDALKGLAIEAEDISVSRIGLSSADLTIKLKFTNPTNYETPTFWMNYTVYVNGINIGSGSIPPMKVVANSTVYQFATITIEYDKVSAAVVKALKQGSFELYIDGEVNAHVLLGLIPFSKTFNITYRI